MDAVMNEREKKGAKSVKAPNERTYRTFHIPWTSFNCSLPAKYTLRPNLQTSLANVLS
jgi:hypothetical protein